MKYIIENYILDIIDKVDGTVAVRLNMKYGEAIKKERRKLYIIYSPNEVLYVGEAGSSILMRIQRGATSFNYCVKNGRSRGGYKGYKWLNLDHNPLRKLNVLTVVFESSFDTKRGFIEAIEGELVYMVRNVLGYWPKFQNEIHFSNEVEANFFAKSIFEKLLIMNKLDKILQYQ